jgi:hypothetical protein
MTIDRRSFLEVADTTTIAPCSWTPEESPVESCEHQDNADIHCQPFPESVSEEHEIYTDHDGCHRHHVKHDSYLSAHFSQPLSLRTFTPVTWKCFAACSMWRSFV